MTMQMTPIDTASATEVSGTIRVRLGAKLKVAPENVRANSKPAQDDISGLCDSIASPVGLLNPLVGYEEDGVHYVTAGRRRLRSLERLKKEKRLPAEIQAIGVSFVLKPKAVALEISLAENAQREAMTVQEELSAYSALSAKGLDASEIAAVTGSTRKRVAQLLSLSHVAPAVLEAFFTGRFDLDTLQAFTLTDDHERQLQVWGRFEGQRHITDWNVRSMLLDSTLEASDRIALFVGRDAYAAAGGTFVIDLFQDGDDTTAAWADSALAHQLAQDKLNEAVEAVRAEGWANVEVAQKSYGYEGGQRRQYPARRDATEAEAARMAELRAISNDHDIGAWDRSVAGEELRKLTETLEVWTDEQKAAGTVFLILQHGGKLTIERAYFRATAQSGGGTGEVKEKPAFGHEGHQRMTRIATTAVRNAVAVNPAVAYDTMVAHQGWMVLRNRSDHGYALSFAKAGAEPAEGITVKGDREYEDLYAAWDERLPSTYLEFFPYVVALSAGEKAELLALCVACQLNAVESRADYRRPRAWAQLGLIAAHAKVDMAERWTPDTEFLKDAGKKALTQAITDMGMDAEPFAKEKRTGLVEIVARNAAKHRWTPPMLATLAEPTLSPSHNKADIGAGPAGAVDDDDFSDDEFIQDEDAEAGTED